MERLTSDERIAVLAACNMEKCRIAGNLRDSDRRGDTEHTAYWQRKYDELNSAYDKLVTWPWEPEA